MNKAQMTNPMLPDLGKLVEIRDMAHEIKLICVEPVNGGGPAFGPYQPGQFAFLSAFGEGEAPFGIASAPMQNQRLEFAVQRLGSVTTALHELGLGDVVGVRGPMGTSFPMRDLVGKNLVVIGGGIGGAPLRPVIQTVLNNRHDYGRLTILWAARDPSLLLFQEEYETWQGAIDTDLHLIVDEADADWDGQVGLITDLLEKVAPSPQDAVTITCGPPIMIRYVGKLLEEMGYNPGHCYVTLEARMHCGVGKCGRCNIGDKLVCVDGPVFTLAEVRTFLESFL